MDTSSLDGILNTGIGLFNTITGKDKPATPTPTTTASTTAKSNSTMLVIGGIAAAVVVLVVVLFAFKGKK